MARDFEDHCWKDVIDADTLQIYQAYRRKIYVGDNPAVLAIDLYNKAYLGGNRPVQGHRPRVLRHLRRERLERAAADPEAVRGGAPRRHSGHLHDASRRHRRRAVDQPQSQGQGCATSTTSRRSLRRSRASS